jgi:hypothetical protein
VDQQPPQQEAFSLEHQLLQARQQQTSTLQQEARAQQGMGLMGFVAAIKPVAGAVDQGRLQRLLPQQMEAQEGLVARLLILLRQPPLGAALVA